MNGGLGGRVVLAGEPMGHGPNAKRSRATLSCTAAPSGRRSFSACRPQIGLNFASARSVMNLLAPAHFNSLRDGLVVLPPCCNASLLLQAAVFSLPSQGSFFFVPQHWQLELLLLFLPFFPVLLHCARSLSEMNRSTMGSTLYYCGHA